MRVKPLCRAAPVISAPLSLVMGFWDPDPENKMQRRVENRQPRAFGTIDRHKNLGTAGFRTVDRRRRPAAQFLGSVDRPFAAGDGWF